jgi:hypothetical protein
VLKQSSLLEAWVATKARDLAVPSDVKSRMDPVPNLPEVIAEAKAHWADHCATCHGNDGKGQTEMGEHMYPPAPDMTPQATQSRAELAAVEPDLAPVVILATSAKSTLALTDDVFQEDTAISEFDQLTVDLVYPPLQPRQHATFSAAVAQHFWRESQTAITTAPIEGP